MNSLTIQVLILVASFLFYRVLRSGFDSWTAVLIDFGAVALLFGLQYFMQMKNNKIAFPSGELSRIVGVSFPDNLSLPIEKTISTRQLLAMQPKEELFMEPNQKIVLPLKISRVNDEKYHDAENISVDKSGFYLMQLSILSDKLDYNAKFSVVGDKNNIDKSIRYGENSFVIYLNGKDYIHFEIENGIHPSMILNQSSIYFVEL